jgi:hypothetical protein
LGEEKSGSLGVVGESMTEFRETQHVTRIGLLQNISRLKVFTQNNVKCIDIRKRAYAHIRDNTTAPAATPSSMLYLFRTSTDGRATKDRTPYITVSQDGEQVPGTCGVEAKKYKDAREWQDEYRVDNTRVMIKT